MPCLFGDSRFVDFTATPQSGSSVQFVTVVVVLVAKVIMRACVCVMRLCAEEMHNYTATLRVSHCRERTHSAKKRGENA